MFTLSMNTRGYDQPWCNALYASPNLDSVPDIDPVLSLVVTPASYANWDAMEAANPTILDFILSAGDYTSWGDLIIDSGWGAGTAERKRTIRLDYPDPTILNGTQGQTRTQHPVNLPESQRAKTSSVLLSQDYWMVSGLWVENDNLGQVQGDCTDVTYDMCLVEGSNGATACRGTNSTRFRQQRIVCRNSAEPDPVADRVGLNFKPTGDNPTQTVREGWVIDCEVYDVTDSFSATQHPDGLGATCHVTVEGCDFYIDDRPGNQIENFVDLKVGDPDNQSVMRYCRMWGDLGDEVLGSNYAFTIHQLTQNWKIDQNIIHGNPYECFGETWTSDEPVRNMEITNNLIIGASHVFRLRTDITTSGNIGLNCGYMVYTDVSKASIGPASHTGNRRVKTAAKDPSGSSVNDHIYEEPPNTEHPTPYLPRFEYWRKRWTGPEKVTVSNHRQLPDRLPSSRGRYIKAHPMGW